MLLLRNLISIQISHRPPVIIVKAKSKIRCINPYLFLIIQNPLSKKNIKRCTPTPESLSYFTVVNSTQSVAILNTRISLLFHRGQFHTKCYINLFIKNIKRCLPRYRILSLISSNVNSPAISVSSSVESSLLFHPTSIRRQH